MMLPLVAGGLVLLLLGVGALAFTFRGRGQEVAPPGAGSQDAPGSAGKQAPASGQAAAAPATPETGTPETPPAAPEQLPPEKQAKAVLTIESRPPGSVRIGSQQGKSPFTTEVEPGDVKVEVSNADEGFSKVEWVKVKPGEQRTREVRVSKVEVTFRSVPEARVFVDGRQIRGPGSDGDVTPIKALIYEGKHQVRFRCADGSEGKVPITVVPSSTKSYVDGTCKSQ
jgi:hypothetical protein